MTPTLRILLVIATLLTFAYIITNIRKARVKIDALFFWILFGLFLVVLSIFPQIADLGTFLTGIYAPINFIVITMIFLVLYKLFTLTLQVSKLQSKIEELTQKLAIIEFNKQTESESADKN